MSDKLKKTIAEEIYVKPKFNPPLGNKMFSEEQIKAMGFEKPVERVKAKPIEKPNQPGEENGQSESKVQD